MKVYLWKGSTKNSLELWLKLKQGMNKYWKSSLFIEWGVGGKQRDLIGRWSNFCGDATAIVFFSKQCVTDVMFSEQTFNIATINAIICTQPSLIIDNVFWCHGFSWASLFYRFWLVFTEYSRIFMVFHLLKFTIVNDAMFLLKHQDRWFWG